MKHGLTYLRRAALVAVFVAAAAAPARADWLLTPYLGVVFGGGANAFVLNDLDDEFEQRITLGGSVGFMRKGIFGLEVDYSVAPNFFQFTGGTGNFDILDLNSSVQTLMGNVVISRSSGAFQPYLAAGVGTIRVTLNSASDVLGDLTSNDTGYNVGGGAHVLFTDHFGLRGDVRYFRGLEPLDDEDPSTDDTFFDQQFTKEDFQFWRATLGVTFRFGG